MGVRKIAFCGLFSALGISLGYALASVPNVELITATLFISGFFLGVKEGILVGIITESLYSLLNPYGMAPPPLFIVQVLCMALAGFTGGVMGKIGPLKPWKRSVLIGLAGFLLTLNFAAATTFSFVILMGYSFSRLMASFSAGMGFYAIHIATNTAIFSLAVPVLLDILKKTGWFESLAKAREVA